jgi:pilus assembly protein TadC
LLIDAGPTVIRARAGILPRAPGVHPQRDRSSDPLAVGSSLDVLAVCLAAGMPVPRAASAAAQSAPPQLAQLLRRAADMLALGADPATAWSVPADMSAGSAEGQAEALLRLARRSASSGAALAQGVAELAVQSRHDAAHAAAGTAERASVLIAGPLGLCFLPAFVCLGIVPVVAGLAGDLLQAGLL